MKRNFSKYTNRKFSLISILISLICSFLCLIFVGQPANAFFEKEKAKINTKIVELKRKEKIEINKLSNKQQNLENTKQSIIDCQDKLETSRSNLKVIQQQYNKLSIEQQEVSRDAGKRIKELYKGERVNNLHFIFESTDLNTFMDRLYYQKVLSRKDQTVLNNLRTRAKRINASRIAIENEKNNIAYALNTMNEKKQLLNSSIKTSQFLINKLRTDRATYEKAQQELEYLSSKLENQIRHTRSTKMVAGSGFIKPIPGIITSPFGWRNHPLFGSRRFHTGVDISNSYGTPIKASNTGKVIYTGWYGGYGKVVIIDHGNMKGGKRISTLYAHLSSISVGNGGSVQKGQTIGYEGTTGYSTGPHLHFEVRLDGKPNNPSSYVRI